MDAETTRRAVIAGGGTISALLANNTSFNRQLAGAPTLGNSDKLLWSDLSVETSNDSDGISAGETVTASGLVTNTGTYEATQDVYLAAKYLNSWRRLDGQRIQLDPGESVQVQLSYEFGIIDETERVVFYLGGEELGEFRLIGEDLSTLTVSGSTRPSEEPGDQYELIEFEAGGELAFGQTAIIDMEAAL